MITCGYWEVVDEVGTYCPLYQTFGSYFYVMLIALCYASRRGLGLSVSMTDVRLLIMVYLRWQLKLTSGWIEAPGESSVVCLYKDRHPGSKGS